MSKDTSGGSISWMARNPVAANLLMAVILIGGVLTTFFIKQEIFPSFYLETVNIMVAYPGSSPEEVEDGIVEPIEEAVRDLENVKKVTSFANEGLGTVTVEFRTGTDRSKALSDVKNAVDRLTTLPEESEEPEVNLQEMQMPVINLVLYGDIDRRTLLDLGEQVRDELLQEEKVTTVDLSGIPGPEISVEISQETLRRYGLTLSEVADKIRASSRDISGGSVITNGGELLLRVKEKKEYGQELATIPIITSSDGTAVELSDLANIVDGLAETDEAAYFNGKPAVMLQVSREGDRQTPIEVSAAVHEYVDTLKASLPDSVSVATFDDRAVVYKDRINLLLKNAVLGIALVLILLGLFLRPRLAFWVTMGIPVSFLGAMLLLPSFNVSINMISLFAFIMAIGIVVDDAIIIGENIYTLRTQGLSGIDAAITGTKELAVPVTFAIITNIIAFAPMLFVEGMMGKIFAVIPIVVSLAFVISLVEAFYILPAHLAHSKQKDNGSEGGISGRVQARISDGIEKAIEKFYRPLLDRSLANRYLVLAIGLAALIIVVGYVGSGYMHVNLAPEAETDTVKASIELPLGAPVEDTVTVQERVVSAARDAIDDLGGDEVYESIFSLIGSSGEDRTFMAGGVSKGHLASVSVILIPQKERDFSGEQFANLWREKAGRIAGVELLRFEIEKLGPPTGKPVDVELTHSDDETLERAASDLALALREFPKAKDVDDGHSEGKPQIDFKLAPEAYSYGLTPFLLGRQVRASFYGAEALRVQRGRNEVKVMVRYPEDQRETEQSVEDMLIRTPAGGEIPLGEVATVKRGRAYNEIKHIDGRRVIEVTAKTTEPQATGLILDSLKSDALPKLKETYPGLAYKMGGEQREISDSVTTLGRYAMLALMTIFVLLGFVFRSYVQPIIILAAIPFGIVGAVVGHLLLGFNFSVISLMGIAALSGVVINDSLVLVDYANRKRRRGDTAEKAIADAGNRRFRPVVLTTLTTFLGLSPMIFETSFQARMMIPMAISLGFGELFSTMIILLLVPCLYLIVEDVKKLFRMKDYASMPTEQEAAGPAETSP